MEVFTVLKRMDKYSLGDYFMPNKKKYSKKLYKLDLIKNSTITDDEIKQLKNMKVLSSLRLRRQQI